VRDAKRNGWSKIKGRAPPRRSAIRQLAVGRRERFEFNRADHVMRVAEQAQAGAKKKADLQKRFRDLATKNFHSSMPAYNPRTAAALGPGAGASFEGWRHGSSILRWSSVEGSPQG
jgi:hypothetical protein